MKKLFLSIGLLAGISGAAQAQTIKYGVKAGASLTSFTGDDAKDAKYKFGFHGGVLANFGLGDMFSIQPEILYSMKGAKYDGSNINGASNDSKSNLGYIDVPVLVKIATGATGLFFEAGPQVGFLLSSKAESNGVSIDFKDYTQSVDFGYAAGLGFQAASGPMVGLRYNGGFTKVGKDGSLAGIPVTASATHNSAFQVYVGFLFGGH